ETGTESSMPPEEIASSSSCWWHAAVPFALLARWRAGQISVDTAAQGDGGAAHDHRDVGEIAGDRARERLAGEDGAADAKGLAGWVKAVLTRREVDVLQLIAGGNANKEIAARLSLTEETVKGHVKNILAKLDANDRTHAVTIGLKRGIIEL
ncbi:MAG: response regulator transcription factor, partial [Bryobacteraceae bacterium]